MAATPGPLQTVLYVDDEPDIRQIVQLALGLAEGLTVHTGESGEQALVLARQLQPDLLLLDVMMPGLDGPGTMRLMRADPVLAGIPVIFMTAKAMPKEVERFLRMGAIGVIAKPFDPIKLAGQVLSVWRGRFVQPLPVVRPEEVAHLQEQLGPLHTKFLHRTRGDLGLMRELIERMEKGDSTVLAQLEQSAHKIHGSGATFGFAAISASAGEIEHLVEALIELDTPVGAAIEPRVLRRLNICSANLAREIDAAAKH